MISKLTYNSLLIINKMTIIGEYIAFKKIADQQEDIFEKLKQYYTSSSTLENFWLMLTKDNDFEPSFLLTKISNDHVCYHFNYPSDMIEHALVKAKQCRQIEVVKNWLSSQYNLTEQIIERNLTLCDFGAISEHCPLISLSFIIKTCIDMEVAKRYLPNVMDNVCGNKIGCKVDITDIILFQNYRKWLKCKSVSWQYVLDNLDKLPADTPTVFAKVNPNMTSTIFYQHRELFQCEIEDILDNAVIYYGDIIQHVGSIEALNTTQRFDLYFRDQYELLKYAKKYKTRKYLDRAKNLPTLNHKVFRKLPEDLEILICLLSIDVQLKRYGRIENQYFTKTIRLSNKIMKARQRRDEYLKYVMKYVIKKWKAHVLRSESKATQVMMIKVAKLFES